MGIFFTGLSFLNRYFFALWQKTGNNGKTTGRKNAGILYQFPRLLFFHVSGVPAYTHALTLAIFLPITTGKKIKKYRLLFLPVAIFLVFKPVFFYRPELNCRTGTANYRYLQVNLPVNANIENFLPVAEPKKS